MSNQDWQYPEPFEVKDYEGFIYQITNIKTGQAYIGKKVFWFKKMQPTGRRKSVESDWKRYWGSSENLKEDIKDHGKENFKREIMLLVPRGYSLSYWENYFLYQLDVLGSTDSDYNHLFQNQRIGSYRNQSRKRRIPIYYKANSTHRGFINKEETPPEGWEYGIPVTVWMNQLVEVVDDE
jgi:hypothetical protein